MQVFEDLAQVFFRLIKFLLIAGIMAVLLFFFGAIAVVGITIWLVFRLVRIMQGKTAPSQFRSQYEPAFETHNAGYKPASDPDSNPINTPGGRIIDGEFEVLHTNQNTNNSSKVDHH